MGTVLSMACERQKAFLEECAADYVRIRTIRAGPLACFARDCSDTTGAYSMPAYISLYGLFSPLRLEA